MAPHGSPDSLDDALRALVLLQRLTVELSSAAEVALGPTLTASLDIKLLLAIHHAGGASPSELVERLGQPRSTLARGLARLRDENVVVRTTSPRDARRAELRVSPLGRRRVERFAAATRSCYVEGEATVKEVMLLLGRDPGTAGGQREPDVLDTAERLAAVSGRFAAEVAPVMAGYGLAESIDRAGLLIIAEHGSARPTRIAHETGLTPAGVTSLVDRLVQQGLVERVRGVEGDGRAVLLRLTPRGRHATAEYVRVFRRHREPLLDVLELTLGHGRAAVRAG